VFLLWLGAMVYNYNPSCSAGGVWELRKPAWAKKLARPPP
jgi:hypothetical protein